MSKSYLVTPAAVSVGMNILVYGDPGVGKTVFAGSAQDHAKMKNVLFLNVEGGLISVAGRGDIRALDVEGVIAAKEPTGNSLEEIFWRLASGDDPDFKGIRTVVIDSVTELQTVNLEEIVAKEMKKNPSKRDDRDFLQQQDYGKSTVQLKRLFRSFRDLPLNVIWTALPKASYPPGAGENASPSIVTPSLTNKLASSLMGYVDFVWYMYTGEDEDGEVTRHLLTQTRGVYQAKTRGVKFADALGVKVDEPDMAELYDLYLKSEEAKK